MLFCRLWEYLCIYCFLFFICGTALLLQHQYEGGNCDGRTGYGTDENIDDRRQYYGFIRGVFGTADFAHTAAPVMGLGIENFLAGLAGMPMFTAVACPSLTDIVGDGAGERTDITLLITVVVESVSGKVFLRVTLAAGEPMTSFVTSQLCGIAVFVAQGRLDYIVANGAGLGSSIGGFGTCGVRGNVLLVATMDTGVPMTGLITAPAGGIAVGGSAGSVADITGIVATMVICMGGQFCDSLRANHTAAGTGIPNLTGRDAGGLLNDGAAVPGVVIGF